MKQLTALALVLCSACSGYSNGNLQTGGIPTTGDQTDGGDAGSDGGDGGADAGPDAGCVAVVGMTVAAIDSCVSGSGQAAQATVYVAAPDAGNACATSITLTSATGACGGAASQGSLNAFNGVCAAMACSSPSLPGTITCTGGCTIRICDAGVCGP
jgi:hypothetical protein